MNIALPDNFIDMIIGYVNVYSGRLSGVVALIVGLLFAFWVLTLVIEKMIQAGAIETRYNTLPDKPAVDLGQKTIAGGEHFVDGHYMGEAEYKEYEEKYLWIETKRV